MSTDIDTQYAWTHLEGEKAPTHRHLMAGDTVYDRDGTPWTFDRVSRKAYGNSTGRVQVSQYCPSAVQSRHNGRTCVHPGHYNGKIVREFFPSVFGLYLGTENGEEA